MAAQRYVAIYTRIGKDKLLITWRCLTIPVLSGEQASAQREAAAAIDLYASGEPQHRSYSDEAGAHAELALGRVADGELEGAREALAPVLDLEPERRIGGIVASAARVHDALRTRTYASSQAARGLRGQIEAFCQVPATALPAS